MGDPAPVGWESLVGALVAGGAVEGKQTLVKVLSLLQLEGFPIEIRFQEFARGPHSFEVHERAEAASGEGWIDVSVTKLGGGYLDRFDYRLTPEGKAVAAAQIQRLKAQDDGEVIADILEEFSSVHDIHRPGNVLSRYTHEILAWDDEESFQQEFAALHEWFEERWKTVESERPEGDEQLLVHAALETVLVTFRGIEPRLGGQVTREEFVGIRFARYNASKIRDDLLAREHDLEEEHFTRRLRRHLYAFEQNAIRYGFLEAMDDDELDALLREAGTFRSGLET